MKIKSIALCALLFSSFSAFAQEENNLETLNQRLTLLEDAKTVSSKLKVSGYIQAQWQSAKLDSAGKASQDMKVGNTAKSGSETTDMNRFGIRRGRIKVAYEDKEIGVLGALQFDLTEKALGLKDAYMQILDPWIGFVSVKGGVFDRPFGYEISYSSSRRESPERSRVFQTLFPDERDLGAMLILQAPKTSPWNVLKLEAGLFAGNGIAQDNDSKKDFIGHLSFNKAFGNVKVGLGASMYSGFVAQTNDTVFTMQNGMFKYDGSKNKGKFASREYFGFDGQVATSSFLGLTTIRGEYLFGTQPANSANSGSPKTGNIAGVDNLTGNKTTDTYIRNFQGGYVQLIQDIADTKHSLVVKYDWYDPNTKVSGKEVGTGTVPSGSKIDVKTSKVDMAYSTIGLGYMYRMNNNVRIMAYYDIVKNEKTSISHKVDSKTGKITDGSYKVDRADNLFTLRFQYKF